MERAKVGAESTGVRARDARLSRDVTARLGFADPATLGLCLIVRCEPTLRANILAFYDLLRRRSKAKNFNFKKPVNTSIRQPTTAQSINT